MKYVLSLTLLTTLLSISLSTNATDLDETFAGTKVKVTIDDDFFVNCQNNPRLLGGVSGVLACEVFQVPSDSKVLNFDRLIEALSYYKSSSSSHCNKTTNGVYGSYGRMAVHFDNKSQTLYLLPDTMECLETMAKVNKRLGSPYKDQVVYLIKKNDTL